MKKDDNKRIKEPYDPQDTPKPPQIIEPNSGRQRENPVEGKDRPDRRQENKEPKAGEPKKEKPHLLADDADIDDETTI